MKNIHDWETRDLQLEAAYALVHMRPTIQEQGKYDQQAYHDSRKFYIAVIEDFIENYGDVPSKTLKKPNE